jgi:hypothetical protein
MARRTRQIPTGWRWVIGGLALLLAVVLGAAGVGGGSDEVPPATASAQPVEPASPEVVEPPGTAQTGSTALELLATIPVKGKAPKTGYDRAGMFGTAWLDVDRNGCDTRNDVLARDLTAIVMSGPCTVASGTLVSPYTSATVDFVRGNDTSALVQIDHLVALSNAWQTGAQQLGQEQRIALANDPLNLLAVDGRSNSQKGDGDTATWLPASSGIRCGYVARQISVKAAYGLWVTQAEADAMTRVLEACPGEQALASGLAAPAATEAVYADCAAVRAAGAAPITTGQPGWSATLDGNGDGTACG